MFSVHSLNAGAAGLEPRASMWQIIPIGKVVSLSFWYCGECSYSGSILALAEGTMLLKWHMIKKHRLQRKIIGP